MGLQRWNTTEYSGVVITTADVVSIIKEMANMLADHTAGTLTETTDTTSTYTAFLDFGDGAFYFSANATSATSATVQMKWGYVSGGAFVSVTGSLLNVTSTVAVNTSVTSKPNVAVLYVVDGGEYFSMRYKLGSTSLCDGALRCIRLTSSLDPTVKYRYAGLTSASGSSATADPYEMTGFTPSLVNLIKRDGTSQSLSSSAPSRANLTATVAVPKIMMYPVLMWNSTPGYEMGVPTLGGKRIYSSGANVPAGTAYYVGTTQYLCAGDYLHIVNT